MVPTGIGVILKDWPTSDMDQMWTWGETSGPPQYGNTADNWMEGQYTVSKAWDDDCALCDFTYVGDGITTTDTYTAGGGTYWFIIYCYINQDFYDPGDGVSVGGNLDFYYNNGSRVQARNTADGYSYCRWQGVISVDNGVKIYPKFMTRNREHNYDHYDDPFWSDAYSSGYGYTGFHAQLYSYS